MNGANLPDFAEEALADSTEALSNAELAELTVAVERLADAFPREPAADASWTALAHRIADGPLRYAPFFDELAELYGLDEAALEAEFERSLDPRSWSLTPFAGVRLFRVRTGPGAPEGYLAQLAATSHIPRHRHPGREVTVVLEGGYRDETGREAHAGDRVEEPGGPGEHSLEVIGGEPCVIALSLEKRFIFASPLYRALLWLFWR